MFYRNSFINKPKGAIWSDGSEASVIFNNEFFGVSTPIPSDFVLAPLAHMMAQSGGLL
jgi:hypothetical protein